MADTQRGGQATNRGRAEAKGTGYLHDGQRARSLGFAIEECRLLLSLYDDEHRASSDVKAIALQKIAEIDDKVAELNAMRATLHHLAEHCHGDQRPDCPILADLAGDLGPSEPR